MGWASSHIERLKAGQTVQFRPRGGSMAGIIASGQLVTVVPIAPDETIAKGDVVLCKVRGAEYLHLVKAERNGSYQIGNNRGGINGWTSRANIFGRFVRDAGTDSAGGEAGAMGHSRRAGPIRSA